MKVTDLAKVIAPNSKQKIIGIRPGEKLHEQMISSEDALSTFEYSEHFKILPQIHDWHLDSMQLRMVKKFQMALFMRVMLILIG